MKGFKVSNAVSVNVINLCNNLQRILSALYFCNGNTLKGGFELAQRSSRSHSGETSYLFQGTVASSGRFAGQGSGGAWD